MPTLSDTTLSSFLRCEGNRFSQLDRNAYLWLCATPEDATVVGNGVCLRGRPQAEKLIAGKAFFREFRGVLVAYPEGTDRDTLVNIFVAYIPGVSVATPEKGVLPAGASCQAVYQLGGVEAIDNIARRSVELPVPGLVELSDVACFDPRNVPVVASGFDPLDKAIGGFSPGQISIWTGKRGSGKSTVVSQILLNAVDAGQRVCAYSGELQAEVFKSWTTLQAAGFGHITQCTDARTGHAFWMPDKVAEERINAWLRGHWWLYDQRTSPNDVDSVLALYEFAVRRYGCNIFLCDNLMSLRYGHGTEVDIYRAQSEFVGALVRFAQKYSVHVHIVAHPRKSNGQAEITDADEVGGSGDITNRADNVFALVRLSKEQARQHHYNTMLSVLKNRAYGYTGQIALCFDEKSRRFTWRNGQYRQYGWAEQTEGAV